MSYDVRFVNPETLDLLAVPLHFEGGTLLMDGNTEADLNITYNYSSVYGRFNFNIRDLYGKTGAETSDVLLKLVLALGTERYMGTMYQWAQVVKSPFNDDNDHKLPENNPEEWNRYIKVRDAKEYLEDPQHQEFLAELLEKDLIRDGGGYWKPTDGNAGYALSILLSWAQLHPQGVWEGN